MNEVKRFSSILTALRAVRLAMGLACALPACPAVAEDVTNVLRVAYETNGICQAVYVGEGDILRGGEVLVAYDPSEAGPRIAEARQALAASELAVQAVRTNALSAIRRFEDGRATAEEREDAEAAFRRAAMERQQALARLQAVHHAERSLMLYAPGPGRVSRVAATPGRAVQAGAWAVEIRADEPSDPRGASSASDR